MSVCVGSGTRQVSVPGDGTPRLFIGGEWVDATGSTTVTSVDPATGEPIIDVPVARPDEVAAAVGAAKDAQRAWASATPGRRAEALVALAERLREMSGDLVRTEAIDAGMPVGVARFDLERCLDSLRSNAALADEVKGTTFIDAPESLLYSLRQPYGVVGVVNPFNHPLLFAVTKAAPALATGNTVVIKAPSAAPLTTLLVAEASRGILPPGVLNVVTGSATTGEALVGDPRVGKISFTGSAATGAQIMAMAARNITPVLLELGGKNASIILPDMSVDRAVAGAVAGMSLKTCGQSCQSSTRAFVHRSLHDEFIEKLRAALARVAVGDPLDERTAMGPIISERQLQTVRRYVQSGLDEGAQLVAGGGRPALPDGFEGGYYLQPTVFASVRPEMAIAREEIFGPVLSVFAWDDLDATIETMNSSPYGLTASIWTDRLDAHAIAARLEAGNVFVNRHGPAIRHMPFGGWKQSGIGTSHGLWEMAEFTRHKSVWLRLA